MWSSLVEYYRPKSLRETLRLLQQPSPRSAIIAGGSWLVAQKSPQIEAVIDLSGLNLAFIKSSRRNIRLGAMTTLQAFIDTPEIHNLANGLLRDASYKCAPRVIRNMATIGGTIAVGNTISDVCLALLVLDAQVIIHTPLVQSIPLHAFFNNWSVNLSRASIITEIVIPQPNKRIGYALVRVNRTPQDLPIVNAAALVLRVGHVCRLVRLALGGVTKHPIRLPEIEGMVSYQKVDAALCDRVADAVHRSVQDAPISDYQREMAGIVVARALQDAWEHVEKE